MGDGPGYDGVRLPAGVRVRHLDGVNGLRMQVLEAGHDDASGAPQRPLLLLLHGFPELAYSWRKVMPALASAGWHVVAPDQRGYGGTTGWAQGYDVDLRDFSMLNLVRDAMELVFALGHRTADAVVGHDFGSPVAAWAAMARPDIFRRAVLMSAPFAGGPAIDPGPGAAQTGAPPKAPSGGARGGPDLAGQLAALSPPRLHYQHYYATRAADADMRHAPQGIHAFLRAYYHVKSADWPGNVPEPLRDWQAAELARLPRYYVMDLHRTMAETVAPDMPAPAAVAACRWLPEEELAVYSATFARTGFQGGLNWYRAMQDAAVLADLRLFAGRSLDVPSAFIAGAADWGIHQSPGALAAMQGQGCTDMRLFRLLDGAGHWVQQEQAEAVAALVLDFLGGT